MPLAYRPSSARRSKRQSVVLSRDQLLMPSRHYCRLNKREPGGHSLHTNTIRLISLTAKGNGGWEGRVVCSAISEMAGRARDRQSGSRHLGV